MKLAIKSKADQYSVNLFGGRLKENKPLSGTPLYSNLIYWAHVEAPEEGAFPMHPHEGIEILTFIFEGGLEHYDTASAKWTPLPAGGVQLIQAGKGVQHAEKYIKGSRAFQIWFDPDFSKSLTKKAFYKDYQAEAFQWKPQGNMEVMDYVGEKAPIQTDAPGIRVKRYRLPIGKHVITTDPSRVQSSYLMEGELLLEGNKMKKDAFAKTSQLTEIHVEATKPSELFVLESPVKVNYQRISQR